MKHITEIFNEDPGWGLRGDKHLWDDFKHTIAHYNIPYSESEFKGYLYQLFKQLTGQSIEDRKEIRVDRFETSGMSGGYVSSEHWQDVIIPKLITRYIKFKSSNGISNSKSNFIYHPDIYKNNEDDSCRFALGIKGKKPLIVFGINPSTADNTKGDPTARKIKGFSDYYRYDSYLIFNLYPQRSTDPKLLDPTLNQEIMRENLNFINELIPEDKFVSILAAWGQTIEIRDYFKICIQEIVRTLDSKKVIWLKIGEPTKNGHPRHPSRAPYNSMLTKFDIHAYIDTL